MPKGTNTRGRALRSAATSALLLALAACDDAGSIDDAAATLALAPEGWAPVDEGDDPYAERRPERVECPAGEGFGVEGYGALEVHTGACNWLSVVQPAPADVPAGATVRVRLWAIDLTAPEPAVATIGVAIDGEPSWSRELPIPSSTQLIRDTFTLDRPVAAGAPIVFHVDNHGSNTYALLELSLEG
ncbi:MAG: hypothetical protein R3B09_23740 [Nannocystaceae bacterium]